MKGQELVCFELINNARLQRGIAPLIENGQLYRAAQLHAKNMQRFRYTAHSYWLDGAWVSWTVILDMVGLVDDGQPNFAGEVALKGAKSGKEAVTIWSCSQMHWAALMEPLWSHIGIAKASDYWVGVLGNRGL